LSALSFISLPLTHSLPVNDRRAAEQGREDFACRSPADGASFSPPHHNYEV